MHVYDCVSIQSWSNLDWTNNILEFNFKRTITSILLDWRKYTRRYIDSIVRAVYVVLWVCRHVLSRHFSKNKIYKIHFIIISEIGTIQGGLESSKKYTSPRTSFQIFYQGKCSQNHMLWNFYTYREYYKILILILCYNKILKK